MFKPVRFEPQNFGGYTLSMILAGLFLGYSSDYFIYIIPSVVVFLIGVYFYAKDNK